MWVARPPASPSDLSASDDRPTVCRRASGKVTDAGNIRLNVMRDEAGKTTIYAAAIPWKARNIAEAGAGLPLLM